MSHNNLQYFVIITEKKKINKFLSLLDNYDAHVIETVYAHGSFNPNVIEAAFGFEERQCKIVITCLLKNDKAQELINILNHEYKFDKPNTGVAFSILVEGLAF